MGVLCEFQVAGEELSLAGGVVGVAGKVEICERAAWEDVACQHLTDGLQVETEPGDTVLCAKEQHEDECEEGREDESPPWQRGLENVSRYSWLNNDESLHLPS